MHAEPTSGSLPGDLAGKRAFTIAEVIVAMAVLCVLIVIVAEILGMTNRLISNSNKAQDADGKARLIMDRIGSDLANMPRRADLDVIFAKQPGNDKLFFYSEAPAYFDTSSTSLFPGSSGSDPKNKLALIGYRVSSSRHLERLGLGLTWDGNPQGSSPGSVVYLSYLNGALDPASTLPGHWPAIIGSAPAYKGSDATKWQDLTTQLLRLEICFLLRDGTLSLVPVLNPDTAQNNLAAGAAPLVTSDSTAGYSPGSRWFDTSAQRAYICVSATPGAAVWSAAGMQDVRAVVAAIVVLDDTSARMVPASALNEVANLFPDITASDLSDSPPLLMKSTWQAVIQAPNFAVTAGLPPLAASQIRVYQRYFFLDAP